MATILVLDDRQAERTYLATLLQYAGYRVIETADGPASLSAIQADRPDLVITDISMPTMDGFEFVRQMRQQPETKNVPVIFYTAQTDLPAQAHDPGVLAYLSKAADRADLYSLLPAAIRRSRSRRPV